MSEPLLEQQGELAPRIPSRHAVMLAVRALGGEGGWVARTIATWRVSQPPSLSADRKSITWDIVALHEQELARIAGRDLVGCTAAWYCGRQLLTRSNKSGRAVGLRLSATVEAAE